MTGADYEYADCRSCGRDTLWRFRYEDDLHECTEHGQ